MNGGILSSNSELTAECLETISIYVNRKESGSTRYSFPLRARVPRRNRLPRINCINGIKCPAGATVSFVATIR